MTRWNILYRGPLSSCNYDCGYCPFAKTRNSKAELEEDQRQLTRFVHWVEQQSPRPIGILMTPWGEALVHRYYRQALVHLSHLRHVQRVAIQTNLSATIDDFAEANPSSFALWATFHPGQTALDAFVRKCHELDRIGVRYSVGVVGLREHFSALVVLRKALRPDVYLWVNAFKRDPKYYHAKESEWLSQIDPYFHINQQTPPSFGKPCHAGETTFSVDGNGDVRRCHFIAEIIGNIYTPDFDDALKPRLCTKATCGCHIGYVHRPELNQNVLYGQNILERIPASWPKVDANFAPPPMKLTDRIG
ncbi:MAG: STM4011 family radical SAM protein [Verrucomicrobiales bacterium]